MGLGRVLVVRDRARPASDYVSHRVPRFGLPSCRQNRNQYFANLVHNTSNSSIALREILSLMILMLVHTF